MNEKIKRLYKDIIKNREKYNLGFWLFLLLTGIFPFIIEIFNLSTFRYYRAYYATVITLSFAIYSFIQQQKKALEEKKKELELKEKELEDKNDYYRPLFLIENMEDGTNNKQVKLLMKNDSLYLEDVKVYNSENKIKKIDKITLQSKDTVVKNITYPFYITGKTMIGEIILFAYLYGGEKHYKYLKYDKDPTIPNGIQKINLSEINEVWGTYNTRTKENNNILDQLVFDNTFNLRREIKQKNFIMFKDSFSAETVNDFMKHIFDNLENFNRFEHSNQYYNNVYNFLLKILDTIKNSMDPTYINISSPPYHNLYFLAGKDFSSHEKLQKRFINSNNFIEIILLIMKSYKNEQKKIIICSQVISILAYAFKEINVNETILNNFILSELKNDICKLKN